MHILHVDIFISLLLAVPVDEEVFLVSPPVDDYFADVAITFPDPLNNGRCIGDGCRWEKMYLSWAELVWGAKEGRGEAVVDSDPVLGDQQWVVVHGVKASIYENMINVEA